MKWLPITTLALDKIKEANAYSPTPIYRSPFTSNTSKYNPRSPNRQFEYGQRPSSAKYAQPMGEWLSEFNENRANIPGVYNRKQDQVYRLGGELPPRNTFWDDEPSEEALSQIRTMNAIKDADASIDRYNSLRKLSTRLPEDAINPFVRSSSPQSLIGAGGRYSNSPLNRIANLNISPSNTREKIMAFKIPELNEVFPDTQQGRGDLYQSQRFGFGTPNDALTRFQAGKDKYRTDMQGWQDLQDSRIAERREGMSLYPGGPNFMGADAIQRAQRDMGVGYNPEDNIRNNLRFDLGKGGKDKTDWLGWAGVGTGLLQGAGGILDYFANMRGLELTEEAMKKKYAADDRNYLAQATALNNVIDTRKDFINKTQGGRNTDFLKNIPV